MIILYIFSACQFDFYRKTSFSKSKNKKENEIITTSFVKNNLSS